MIKTLGAYIQKEFKCINCDTVHDSGSFDGDDDSI